MNTIFNASKEALWLNLSKLVRQWGFNDLILFKIMILIECNLFLVLEILSDNFFLNLIQFKGSAFDRSLTSVATFFTSLSFFLSVLLFLSWLFSRLSFLLFCSFFLDFLSLVTYESVENGSRKKSRKLKTALHSIMPKLKNDFTPKRRKCYFKTEAKFLNGL